MQLFKVQNHYGQLDMICRERIREHIEATYQEIQHALANAKDKHLDKLQLATEAHTCIIDEAIAETYATAWKDVSSP